MSNDPYRKILFDRKPDHFREIWVLVWKEPAPKAGRVVTADEGGWLMFESKDHAFRAQAFWGWTHTTEPRLLAYTAL